MNNYTVGQIGNTDETPAYLNMPSNYTVGDNTEKSGD
jgi:hypothetical protein